MMSGRQNLASLTRGNGVDLTEMAERIGNGRASATECMEQSIRAAGEPAQQHSFIRRFDGMARAAAATVDCTLASGAPLPALAGLAVSIKDLFDVAGVPTTAASASMADAAPAPADCPAVQRLRQAGAALIGHTNLTEFAFSGVGINPHHGTALNVGALAVDDIPRIPGGSTSGGASTVAGGAAWAALGSDTRGSIRVPAALQGLVGFKNTQALTPNGGCVPLSFTLDTTCAITRSVRDAVLLHELLASRQTQLTQRPLASLRLALPKGVMLEGLDVTVSVAFERSLRLLRAAGVSLVEVALPVRVDPAACSGRIGAAEAWAWHRHRLEQCRQHYDPRVLARVRMGSETTAADYIDLLQQRQEWIVQMGRIEQGFDAFICPTVPMVAPPMQPLIDDDTAFFATNMALLRNPSAVNYLNGCALSLPCHVPGELPVGLMIWAGAYADDRVLAVSLAIERALADAGR